MPGLLVFFAEARWAIATLHHLNVTSRDWLHLQLLELVESYGSTSDVRSLDMLPHTPKPSLVP
jgi:hypothetical protein